MIFLPLDVIPHRDIFSQLTSFSTPVTLLQFILRLLLSPQFEYSQLRVHIRRPRYEANSESGKLVIRSPYAPCIDP